MHCAPPVLSMHVPNVPHATSSNATRSALHVRTASPAQNCSLGSLSLHSLGIFTQWPSVSPLRLSQRSSSSQLAPDCHLPDWHTSVCWLAWLGHARASSSSHGAPASATPPASLSL